MPPLVMRAVKRSSSVSSPPQMMTDLTAKTLFWASPPPLLIHSRPALGTLLRPRNCFASQASRVQMMQEHGTFRPIFFSPYMRKGGTFYLGPGGGPVRGNGKLVARDGAESPKRHPKGRAAPDPRARKMEKWAVVVCSSPVDSQRRQFTSQFLHFLARARSQKGGEKRDIVWPKDGEGSLQVANAAVSYPTVIEGVVKGKTAKVGKNSRAVCCPQGGHTARPRLIRE